MKPQDMEDYDDEFLRDQAIIHAEEQARMEAEWREMEEHEMERQKRLPARIEILIPNIIIKNEEEVSDGRT